MAVDFGPAAVPLWQPTARNLARTHLAHFQAAARTTSGVPLVDYAALHAWSIAEPAAFWSALSDYAGVRYHQPASTILERPDAFPGARWFAGAQLNFADNLLRYRDDRPAIISVTESGARTELSYKELYGRVLALTKALKTRGVQPGDRVAGWLPNSEAAVIAMLATTALGAVWSSCSPDFGEQGAIDRFGQIEPVLLFACEAYEYAGKEHATRTKVSAVASAISSIRDIIWVAPTDRLDSSDTDFAALTEYQSGDVDFCPVDFNDPLYVMYSSGTTGVPKCIVHGVGGTLLQHQKEHLLHVDLHRDDRLFFFTTCGWMMWNWLVAGLSVGATLALYDGSPFYPDGNVLFDYADEVGVNVFGTSAKFIDALNKENLKPIETHDLSDLRLILSTGSPLVDEGFDYVYRGIKKDVQLSSISGGTDIVSCFVLGNPVLPVWTGEIQSKGLGMAVEIWDEGGDALTHGKGELVCTKPFPSMPIGFWNDPDGVKYAAAYFERFPGVWHHGDFAEVTEHGGIIIHGRSDATLNPGGVRIGTAEIYAVVETLPEIREAIAVGQTWQDDVRVVLFVVLAEGAELTDDLIATIRSNIRKGASPRHVPAKIVAVADIPRTKSGKITELAVRDIIEGREVKNREALANPEALDLYRDLDELQT